MNKEKIISRIEKLFRLSENNTNESESRSAIAKARKLMAEHKIEMAEISSEDQEEEVVRNESKLEKSASWWHVKLNKVIAPYFRCIAYTGMDYVYGQKRSKKYTGLLGFKEDVDIARAVYDYAKICIEHFSKEFVRDYGSGKKEWIYGYIQGLEVALEEQTKSFSEETALMMIVPEAVTKECESEFETVRSRTKLSLQDDIAKRAGYNAGLRFDHNRKMID